MTTSDPLVLDLDDTRATLEVAGGKGASLARMAAAKLPVPPGFHVTTAAYRHFVDSANLHDKILRTVTAADPDRPASIEAAAAEIAGLFAEQPVPEEITAAVRAAYAQLGDEVAVAVRSSATAEDLPEMSFAGQQDTYLNIRGAEQVLAAVQRCWASLWTARAIDYRARQGIESDEVSLAVVVQELVPADAAGVLFTADPLTGARDRVMINAAWGLGEAIVSGNVTPDTLLVAKSDGQVLREDISDKRSMTVRTATGTEDVAVPEQQRNARVLEADRAAELTELAVRIEELYGQPMDIEWAVHDGELFIVQARPITVLPDDAPKPATEWELPDRKGKYMRASVLELLPEPLSPLFATLGLPAFGKATKDRYDDLGLPYFDNPLVVINGYGYYDITYTPGMLARMLLAQPRFLASTLPRALRTAPQRWRAGHTRYTEVTAEKNGLNPAQASATELLEAARAIVEEAARYYLTLQGGVLPATYISEGLFSAAYKTMKRRDDPAALTFLLGFDSKPLRAEKSLYELAQWIHTQPGLADRVENLSGTDLLALLHDKDASSGNQAWHEFLSRFAEHLATYGDTVYDLDFAAPLPVDDPAPLLQTLAFFGTPAAHDPHDRQRNAQLKREQAMRRLQARRPGVRRWLTLRLLRWAQTMSPLREDGLADVGLGWPTVRRLLHELGRRLVTAGALRTDEDVFWLRLDELQDAARALDDARPVQDSRAVVAERKATAAAQRMVTPPHALPVSGGAKLFGLDFSKLLPAGGEQDSGATVKGVPGSPGRVTAPARIIHGPEDFSRLRPGDVLVTKITTPAWTPLFALASAVVTDVGGPLSHSSIVAREYHIPAVLGTGVATERLPDGARVTVDGDAGTVTLATS
ncbi:PEP/pyruvate-binding domain-containing protein [Nocardia suismassiliense]|uniref:PEP/pyruvate-binding domain-containing protein n=1 Tax=Nocardia suismassiliense TaxID=2077092 RepID=UPI000D1DC535|nr:PEP/pyruvate-binding domain-containing protein [Nocardia suismassiliense]